MPGSDTQTVKNYSFDLETEEREKGDKERREETFPLENNVILSLDSPFLFPFLFFGSDASFFAPAAR